MKKKSPDYNNGSSCYGGHKKNFSKKQMALRFFPGCGHKRKVTATITTWIGSYSVGAVHYYVKLEEEQNPFWDGEGWRECWDEDGELKNIKYETKSKKRALELREELFKDNFNSKTHKLIMGSCCFD